MELAFADAGLLPPFVPELEPRLTSFELGYGDPSWLAALEAIVGSWLAAGLSSTRGPRSTGCELRT